MKNNYTYKKISYFNKAFSLLLLAGFLTLQSNSTVYAADNKKQSGALSLIEQLDKSKVSIKRKDVPLTDILKDIQKQGNVSFAFEKNLTPESMGKFTLNVNNVSIKDALRILFNNTDYTYVIDGKSVVISRKAVNYQTKKEMFEVKGLVVDGERSPITGATVMVMNTPKGAITDENGRFIVKVSAQDKIEISFIGYKTEILPVTAQTNNVVITLTPEAIDVDDVVVIAYGSQKKESMVGSITTVDTRQLKSSSSDLTSTFAGNIAGIIGFQTGGMPGALTEEEMNTKFYIRGITSFQTGANVDPLILIDGVESSKLDLSRMPTEDIETFSVMKDASATAMYGARGANGVILVTTKKGQEGSVYTSVRYESVLSRPTREIDIVDPVNYMRMYNRALLARNPEATPKYSVERIDRTGSGNYPSWVYPANDWYNIMFKDFSINHRAGVNIRGGSRLVQYYASLNYVRDEGMLKTDRLNQFDCNIESNTFSFRTNLNINLTSGIRLNLNAAANLDKSNGPYTDVREVYGLVFNASPVDYAPLYPADETYGWPHLRFGSTGNYNTENPYMQLHQGYKDRRRFSATTRVEYIHNLSALMKGLELRASASINNTSYSINAYHTVPFEYRLADYDFETGKHTLQWNNQGKASRTLSKNMQASGGTQATQISYEAQMLHVAAWGEHQTSLTAVFNGQETTTSVGRTVLDGIPRRNMGVSMRGSYGYKNKYFAEASFGYNGSERFAKKHRYGFFPSIGGAWIVSKEKFFENSIGNWFSFLKLRLSWGKVGNDGVINDPRFTHLPILESKSYPSPVLNVNAVPTHIIKSYPNDKITWEIAEQSNIGIETKFFDGLVEVNADIYREIRHNILDYRYTMPATTGLDMLQIGNVGRANSKGIDLSAKVQHSFSKDFWMILNGTFTYSKAVYDEIEESDFKPEWQRKKGQEIRQGIGYIAEGVFYNQEEINNSPRQGDNVMPGDIRYRDLNGDGVIDVNDATYIGFPDIPRVIYGFNAMFSYKNVELNIAFQGAGKRSLFMNPMKISPFVGQRAMLKAIYDDHWDQTNMSSRPLWPRLSAEGIDANNPFENWYSGKEVRKSTYFMREASFLRCTNIELGYNIPENLLKKIKLQNVKIYGRVNNPFLISNFDIWDVELGDNGFNYPIQRTWAVGLNVSF